MKAALRFLIRRFPAPFRERFGAEMMAQIDEEYDEARSRGFFAASMFALATAWDLARGALMEHSQPTWSSTASPQPVNHGASSMRTQWLADLRHAVRALSRRPGFTIITVATLGLAIGVNAGMFTVVETVLLDPLPFAHQNRLVTIAASAPGSGMPDEFGVAAEFFLDYRSRSKLIEDVSTYNSFTNTLHVGDRIERVRMSYPTNSLFTTLGAKPILGRLPTSDDGDNAVVISYRLWKEWFDGDRAAVGRLVDVGNSRRIVGIMGPEFHFPDDATLLWLSSEIRPGGIVPGRFGARLVARVKPGTTPEALATELTSISKTLPERYGGSAAYRKLITQHHAVVKTLRDAMLGPVSQPLWVLLGGVSIVLLIACANVANLFMVRAEGRQRDLAVRRAIGATRTQLVQSQMAESIVVAVAAGVLAALFAALSLPAFVHAAPSGIPRIGEVHVGLATIGFTIIAAVFAAIVCGIVPAIRGSSPDLARLRDGGRGATRQAAWARNTLVVAQTALALVLLIGSGLLLRSFWALRHVKPGYQTENLFTFQIAPSESNLRDGPSLALFDLEFMKRLRALPGVETVGLVENIPLDEGTSTQHFRSEEMGPDADGVVINSTFSAGDYYKAMGIAVLRGRPFTDADILSNQRYVVVSKSAANALWPNQDAIGKRLQLVGLSSWETVIGVVDDVMQDDFRHKPDPLVYFPLIGPEPRSWVISSPAYVVKTRRAESIASEIRALVRNVSPSAPMYRVFTMAELARTSMLDLSFTMLTLGVVSALALFLAAIGLYGVLSYVVAQRTREIGIRIALGAEAGRVRRMVVWQGATVVGIGIAIGFAIALASTRALGSLLFGVTSLDPITFVGVSASMVVIGLMASYVPAHRASTVDPTESLRGE